MIETKSTFTPLPAEVLKKIIDDGNYVLELLSLEGKFESYYISYAYSDSDTVMLCSQDGEDVMTANPGTFGYKGDDIFFVNDDNRPCIFTLVKRVETAVNVNDLL